MQACIQTVEEKSLTTVLAQFQPIGIEEMDHANLQNRKESKYLLSAQQAYNLITHLSESYYIFEIDGKRIQTYSTMYYDSPQLKLYLDHHNGKKPRYKVRTRSYIGSDLTYLEVKEKKNTGRTVKHRLRTPGLISQLGTDFKDFLTSYLPYDYSHFKPVLLNEYHRITLVSATKPERITFDSNLTYHSDSIDINLHDIVIAEIKRSSDNTFSPALNYLNSMRIREKGFSKYCIGITLLYGNLIKHNNFMITLRFLNKIMQGELARC